MGWTAVNDPKPASIMLVLALLCVASGCAAEPEIVPRSAWGWQPGNEALPEHSIDRITIHHGGTEHDENRDTAEYLRALQSWSRSDKGWTDLPYHYIIDLDGRIFEGRPIQYPGDTNTSYDTRGHALIVITGNYDNRELSDTQFESLAKLVAHLARKYSVDPGDIRGHKDYAPGETLCPGASIYRHLEDGSLLQRAAELAGWQQ